MAKYVGNERTSRLLIFSLGKFGCGLLFGIVTSWFLYFYQPGQATLAEGHVVLIPTGVAFLGATIAGLIFSSSRVFEALISLVIADRSDRSTAKLGRRMSFMRWSSIPAALTCFLVFVSPIPYESNANSIFLLLMVYLFFLFVNAYNLPLQAFSSEFVENQDRRVVLFTYLSVLYLLGTFVSYVVPVLATLFVSNMSFTDSYRASIAVLSALAGISMIIPTFAIKETNQAESVAASTPLMKSLSVTLKNRDARAVMLVNLFGWAGLTIFQTGASFYVTELVGYDNTWSTAFLAAVMGVSVISLPIIIKIGTKVSRRKLLIFFLAIAALSYCLTACIGMFGIPGYIWMIIIAIFGGPQVGAFGLFAPSFCSDVAQADSIESGEHREGMYFAARNFGTTIGCSAATLLFSAVAMYGSAGEGYRISVAIAAIFAILALISFLPYREKRISDIINGEASQTL